MPVLFAKTGKTSLRVAAVFSDDTFGQFFISLPEYEQNFTTQQDTVVLARARQGVSPEPPRPPPSGT